MPRKEPAVSCSDCALYMTGQVLGLGGSDCSLLDQVVLRDHNVARNEILCSAGDPFRYLYLVHSGACISYTGLTEDTRHVMGFYLPGELAGIDAIGQKSYTHTVVALERGSICRLDYSALQGSISDSKLLSAQRYLLDELASYSRQVQWERVMTGFQGAEQRVAAFLLNIASRFRARGLPADSFRLPMSREAIADYLGLAGETVIRTLQKLQSQGLLRIKAKQIEMLEPASLDQLAHSSFVRDQ